MRIACVDLLGFPLQLLLRREPAWRELPVVVVEEDRPQSAVRWVNEAARACGVLPGQRYATALALAPGLRAGVVPPEEIARAQEQLATRLLTLSPEVSRADEPGTFWLGGAGMSSLHSSASGWGKAMSAVIAELGFIGVVVVGFSRFATLAVARARGRGLRMGGRAEEQVRLQIYAGEDDERRAARSVPLDRLEIAIELRDALARLGVTTLGQMVALPGGGILERFGSDAYRLYQLAAGERWDPLQPEPPPEAAEERVDLDDPEREAERLVFAIKAAVDRLLARLAANRRAVVALYVELNLRHSLAHHERRVDCIKPATATLDGRSLLGLIHLRLEHQPPSAGVSAIRVWADDVPAVREQLALFADKPRRDRRAGDAALARLRAELGDDAIVRAELRDGHLPEARYGWVRLEGLAAPRPASDRPRVLVRRILARPLGLAGTVSERGGELPLKPEWGSLTRTAGPYVVSGGWWAHLVHREYHYVEVGRGDCLWLYFDRARQRWFQHGSVQ